MMKNMLLRAGIVGTIGVAMLVPAPASAAEVVNCAVDHQDERQASWNDDGIGFTSSIEDNGRPLAPGRYALPETSTPTQLVVMFHGHGNDSCSWRRHLQDVAARGAVAVAMDYTGVCPMNQCLLPDGASYGWFTRAGAADSIAAARYFITTYPSITKVIALGISMGGNMSGYAIASKPMRTDGVTPLFDYWIDIEGVNNLIEEYLVARAVAEGTAALEEAGQGQQNATAALAVREIEQENGGTLEEEPENYIETTNVLRAGDMASLKGAVVVNGFDDGLVPTDQTPQMTAALMLVNVPTRQINVVLRGSGEAGTTGSAIVAGPLFEAAGEEYESPLAGHGWEGSDTQLVIRAGFDALYAIMDGAIVFGGVTVIPGA